MPSCTCRQQATSNEVGLPLLDSRTNVFHRDTVALMAHLHGQARFHVEEQLRYDETWCELSAAATRKLD